MKPMLALEIPHVQITLISFKQCHLGLFMNVYYASDIYPLLFDK
jgi:hypothetical protein